MSASMNCDLPPRPSERVSMPKSHPHFASDWLGIGGFGVERKSPSTVSLKQLKTRLIRVALISIHHPFTFSSTGPTENFRVLAFKTRAFEGPCKFSFLAHTLRKLGNALLPVADTAGSEEI